MDLAERLLYLRSMPAGPLLQNEHLWMLASHTTEKSYRPNALVFAQHDPVSRLVFMRQGSVVLEQDGMALGVLESPGAVGVRALLANVEMPYAARARSELVTMEIDADTYTEMLEDHFDVWLTLVRFTFGNLLAIQKRDHELLHLGPPSAVAIPQTSSLVERILYLRRHFFFGQTSVNALAEVAQRMEEQTIDVGHVLYEPGEPADRFYLPLSGQLTFTTTDNFSCPLDHGVPFGMAEAMAQQPRWGRVVASRPTRLLCLHIEPFLDVLEDNTEMAMSFLQRISRLMLELNLAQLRHERSLSPEAPLRALTADPTVTTTGTR